MSKPIIVITGPTASGKTSLSFAVTKNFPSEIICADSMTVYQGMDIGTDKPGRNVKNRIPDIRTREKKEFQVQNLNTGIKHKNKNSEQSLKIINGIPHHLLDIVTPNQEFNVTFFKKLANEKIKEIHKRGNIPFVVGGSTLYIDTLVYDFQIPQVEPDLNLRKKLEKKTNPELFRELVSLDPDVEWTIDRNNKRRLIRALEVCHISGQPFTRQKHKKELGSNILYLSVEKERKELYKNINMRVDEMIESGFLEEVKILRKKYDHNTAMQAAGYKQLIQYLDGEISLAEAIEKTKQVHRNYAKRQLTWLRKNKDVTWIKDGRDATTAIKKFLKEINFNKN